MTEPTRSVRGDARIKRLAERPDLAEGVTRTRREMAEADAAYARGLAALRRAAELTQVELARRLGVTQAAVSRMEQPHDMLLSTLNAYLAAVGGHGTLVVHFDTGADVTLDLGTFDQAPEPVPRREGRPYGLTGAQLDVVALLPKGLSDGEIAAELGIPAHIVKTHLRHALHKLKVPDRAQAAALVKREGLA